MFVGAEGKMLREKEKKQNEGADGVMCERWAGIPPRYPLPSAVVGSVAVQRCRPGAHGSGNGPRAFASCAEGAYRPWPCLTC
jgi:hypothetical protein